MSDWDISLARLKNNLQFPSVWHFNWPVIKHLRAGATKQRKSYQSTGVYLQRGSFFHTCREHSQGRKNLELIIEGDNSNIALGSLHLNPWITPKPSLNMYSKDVIHTSACLRISSEEDLKDHHLFLFFLIRSVYSRAADTGSFQAIPLAGLILCCIFTWSWPSIFLKSGRGILRWHDGPL